ncbi:MAG TPA: LysM peptidoglycan-binding domain-containing protein [Candidatus Angelobacter sp.]|nr:LysM peptidoglycan-binding domain-containing protein [Candidatus Angelobacter sp.]
MTQLVSYARVAVLLLLCVWWSACSFSSDSGADEEKAPDYLAGRSRKAALNYTGAIESFEKALEANPRSAAAHLELGLIYYQNVATNWARAIYHFEKYLELRPKADNADLIRQNIDYCKLALAREVPYTPNNDLVRKEVERMARENADLRQQVDQLMSQLTLRAVALTNSSTTSSFANSSTQRTLAAARIPSNPSVQYAQTVDRPSGQPPAGESAPPAGTTKTHVVKSGDTPYSIARNYGVKLVNLLSANPGLDPRHLRPGQSLVIPLP